MSGDDFKDWQWDALQSTRTISTSRLIDQRVRDLAQELYSKHAESHGFTPRWDDEPHQSRSSWRNIARSALDWVEARNG